MDISVHQQLPGDIGTYQWGRDRGPGELGQQEGYGSGRAIAVGVLGQQEDKCIEELRQREW